MTYNNLDVFGHTGPTRKAIFQLFMQLRANDKFHIGVEKIRGQPVHYSPYLICKTPLKESSNPSGNIGKNVSYLSLAKACIMVVRSLKHELDYQVLSLGMVSNNFLWQAFFAKKKITKKFKKKFQWPFIFEIKFLIFIYF